MWVTCIGQRKSRESKFMLESHPTKQMDLITLASCESFLLERGCHGESKPLLESLLAKQKNFCVLTSCESLVLGKGNLGNLNLCLSPIQPSKWISLLWLHVSHFYWKEDVTGNLNLCLSPFLPSKWVLLLWLYVSPSYWAEATKCSIENFMSWHLWRYETWVNLGFRLFELRVCGSKENIGLIHQLYLAPEKPLRFWNLFICKPGCHYIEKLDGECRLERPLLSHTI